MLTAYAQEHNVCQATHAKLQRNCGSLRQAWAVRAVALGSEQLACVEILKVLLSGTGWASSL